MMMAASGLGSATYVSRSISVNEWFNAVLNVTVGYYDLLSYFPNLLRLNISVSNEAPLKSYFSGLSI